MKEISYYRSDLEALLRNPVWKEMKENAAELLIGLQEDLETLDPMHQAVDIARTQGKMQIIRIYFDGWIADIKKDIEEYEEEIQNGTR